MKRSFFESVFFLKNYPRSAFNDALFMLNMNEFQPKEDSVPIVLLLERVFDDKTYNVTPFLRHSSELLSPTDHRVIKISGGHRKLNIVCWIGSDV